MKCKFHKNCFTTVLRIFGDFNDSLVMGKKYTATFYNWKLIMFSHVACVSMPPEQTPKSKRLSTYKKQRNFPLLQYSYTYVL